jgi:hypothetical protein
MKNLTEQEEQDLLNQFKPTIKDKIEDWFYDTIDKIDNTIILILSMCTVLGILLLIQLF